jgi:hypothetical protein
MACAFELPKADAMEIYADPRRFRLLVANAKLVMSVGKHVRTR